MSQWRSICRIWPLYLSNHAEIIWNHSKPYSIKVLCHYGSFLECSCCRRCAAHEAHLDEPWKHGPWKAWWLHEHWSSIEDVPQLSMMWACFTSFTKDYEKLRLKWTIMEIYGYFANLERCVHVYSSPNLRVQQRTIQLLTLMMLMNKACLSHFI